MNEYTTNELGLICNPGKFEGEHPCVPFFWNLGLEGGADEETDDGEFVFRINEDERAMFPVLCDVKRLVLWETDSGFVYSTFFKD